MAVCASTLLLTLPPMKKLLSSLHLIVIAIILAACSSETGLPPIDRPFDWCYVMDFKTTDYGGSLTGAVQVIGEGLKMLEIGDSGVYSLGIPSSTAPGVVKYTVSNFVEIGSATAYFEFFHISPAGTTVDATFELFGISQRVEDYFVPANIGAHQLELRATEAGVSGKQAALQMTSTNGTVALTKLVLNGWDYNPFPSNNCAPGPTMTASPVALPSITPSNTQPASATPTASLTPTATYTPSITPTPSTGDWCWTWDFTESGAGWNVVLASYVAGVGYQNTGTGGLPYTADLSINPVWSAGILEHISVDAISTLATSNGFRGVYYPGTAYPAQTGYLANTGAYTMSFDVNNSQPPELHVQVSNNFEAGTNTIQSITLEGSGIRPSFSGGEDCSPEMPTATPDGTGTLSSGEMTGTALAATVNAEQMTATAGAIVSATAGANGTATALAGSATATTTQTFGDLCNFQNFSFDNGLSPWIGTAGQATGAAVFQPGEHLSQTVSLEENSYFLTLVASIDQPGASSSDGEFSFTYLMTNPDTSTETATTAIRTEQYLYQNSNQVALVLPIEIDAAGSYGFKLTANLTDVTSIKLLSACVSEVLTEEMPDDNEGPEDGSGGWHTCGEIITPPSSVTEIGGWIKYLWDSTDKAIQCIIMPPVNAIRDFVVGAFTWFFNTTTGFVEWSFGKLLPFVIGSLQNFFAALLELLRHGFGDILNGLFAQLSAVGNIAGSIGDILTSYANTSQGYIGVAVYQVNSLVTAYNSALSTPPAGLPDCIIAPLDHELCAVFWVMENTFFSGTVGQLLVPAVCVFIDMLILLYFGNMIKRFIIRLWNML